ncbi:MAG: pyridoxamine 5'-phosphate oxidase family protein [Nitrososphaerales archaeon]
MVKIPENVKKVALEAIKKKTFALGTTDKKGYPNAVPVACFQYPAVMDDDKFVIIHNYFDKTIKNLQENPFASLTFWDPETREGYQVKGPVEIKSSGDFYERITSEIRAKRPDLPLKSVIILRIEEIYNIKPGLEAGKRIG